MELDPYDVAEVQAQQTAGLALIDGDFQVVADAKKTKFFSFRNFVIVPAELGYGFAFPEIEGEISVSLNFCEQVFGDVGNDIAKGVDINDTTADDVAFNDRIEQHPLLDAIGGHSNLF